MSNSSRRNTNQNNPFTRFLAAGGDLARDVGSRTLSQGPGAARNLGAGVARGARAGFDAANRGVQTARRVGGEIAGRVGNIARSDARSFETGVSRGFSGLPAQQGAGALQGLGRGIGLVGAGVASGAMRLGSFISQEAQLFARGVGRGFRGDTRERGAGIAQGAGRAVGALGAGIFHAGQAAFNYIRNLAGGAPSMVEMQAGGGVLALTNRAVAGSGSVAAGSGLPTPTQPTAMSNALSGYLDNRTTRAVAGSL